MPDDHQSSPSLIPRRSPPQSPSLVLSSYSVHHLIALSSTNPRKRKECPDDNVQTDKKPSSAPHPDEYGAGFITCQTCSSEVSFRDENNAFTTKLWDAHRLTWSVTLSYSHIPYFLIPDSSLQFYRWFFFNFNYQWHRYLYSRNSCRSTCSSPR